jgi:thioredoxin-dependent peroxiredoxin
VAADAGAKIAKQYDATIAMMPNMADRISYVISPQGKIIYAYSSLSPDDHVANTMKALQAWRKENPR